MVHHSPSLETILTQTQRAANSHLHTVHRWQFSHTSYISWVTSGQITSYVSCQNMEIRTLWHLRPVSSNTLQGEEHMSGTLTNMPTNELEHMPLVKWIYENHIFSTQLLENATCLLYSGPVHKMFASSCLLNVWRVLYYCPGLPTGNFILFNIY